MTKLTEKEKVEKTIKHLNKTYGWELYKTENEFCHWDAQSADIIVELKFRKDTYPDKYLQVDKFLSLLMAADFYDKMLYYIVIDKKVSIFNLKDLKDELLKSKIHIQQAPYSTEFKDRTKKVDKYFYILEPKHKTKL